MPITLRQIVRHPIKAVRRLQELEERVSHATVTLMNDLQYLHHDTNSRVLNQRHLDLVSEGWRKVPFEHITRLRDEMGLDPYRVSDIEAYQYAICHDDFCGTFSEWCELSRARQTTDPNDENLPLGGRITGATA